MPPGSRRRAAKGRRTEALTPQDHQLGQVLAATATQICKIQEGAATVEAGPGGVVQSWGDSLLGRRGLPSHPQQWGSGQHSMEKGCSQGSGGSCAQFRDHPQAPGHSEARQPAGTLPSRCCEEHY